MTSKTILLKPDTLYDLGGKQYTLEELREHAIDSMMLKELMEK